MLDDIEPIVLVGGKSRRFGRDKLREPLDSTGRWMVDAPIAALREVFGFRVALVGDCDSVVAARGDRVLPDRYPGAGPAGGVLSALELTGRPVFVLSGDLPAIRGQPLREIVQRASEAPHAWAVLATTDVVQPCIGIYRPEVTALLAERLRAGRRSLHDLVPPDRLTLCRIPPADAANANTQEELRRMRLAR